MVLASAGLSDDEFLEVFHSHKLPPEKFRHADHLRLAWLHTHREPREYALRNVCSGIREFAARNGAPDLYHETITTAWVLLISTHDEQTFEAFLNENRARLNRELLYRFWTPSLLASGEARTKWVAPDRQDLPGGTSEIRGLSGAHAAPHDT
jgi:hypothetical protein